MFLDAYNFTSLFLTFHHCVKYQNFTKFPGEGLWVKGTVFAEFWAFYPETLRKLRFHKIPTRKFGYISVFYAVRVNNWFAILPK